MRPTCTPPFAATHPIATALALLLLLTRPSRPRTPNTYGAQAAKMAAMDSAFGWIFSYPDAADPAATGNSLAPEAPFYPAPRPAPSLLAFADVAAGPGGFSEYLLWRRGASALGIGFTLRGTHDFTLSRFHYRSLPELFHAYYGPKDDGDLYVSSNIRALQVRVSNPNPNPNPNPNRATFVRCRRSRTGRPTGGGCTS